MTDSDRWPGYTAEAQAYEMATRTITVEFLPSTADTLDEKAHYTQEFKAKRGRGLYRPVSHREWLALERRIHHPRPKRKPLGIHGAPRPVLMDGRSVDDVLDRRTKRHAKRETS